MEPLLEAAVNVCLKKSMDTNGFLAEEADKALLAICSQAPERRTADVLVHALNTRYKNAVWPNLEPTLI